MTSPVVGSVSVEITASAKTLAKSLRAEVEKAFKDLDLGKAIRDAVGTKPVRLPVTPDVDADAIPETVRRTRVPKLPVELDPVTAAFKQQVRRETTALAKQVAMHIPVDGDTGKLRGELSAQLAAVQTGLKVQVPVDLAGKAEYEAKLRAQLAQVAATVKQTVKVDVDVDTGRSGGSALRSLGGLLQGLTKGLPTVGKLTSGLSDLGGAAQKAAGSSAQLGGNLVGAGTSAAGPIGLVIGLLVTAAGAAAAVAGAVTLLVPAFSAAAGAAAAIPAALVGVGAAIGTLALGFKGIGAAFKSSGGGGGGGGGQDPAARARQIAAAERGVEAARRGITAATRGLAAAQRGLESAQRSYQESLAGVAEAQKRAVAAQQAVNRARVEAREGIEDLGRALRGAQLDEESAALAVTDALRELNEVRLSGNIPDIQRAELAYRQAQLTLENARDTAQDLGEEQAEANRKGVEGSDDVVAALEAQADAQKGVKDAQNAVLDAQNGVLAAQDALASANDGLKSSYDGLASAQDALAAAQTKMASGSAGVGAEMVKLAPNAQKFVNAIKALKPAFEALRLDVQQRLFAGLDRTVTDLGRAWIPALRTTLGAYADTFNGFFRNLGSSLTQPKFIADIQAGAEGARRGLAAIGTSITQSLVPAFGALSRAAAPFMEELGKQIAGVVTEFSNWVLQGERTGGLREFFTTATESMRDLFRTGKLVGKIIGDLFKVITGSNLATGKTPLDSLNNGLEKVHEFLSDPANADQIKQFFTDAANAVKAFVDTAASIGRFVTQVQGLYDRLFPNNTKDQAKSFGSSVGDALIAGLIAGLGAAVKANFQSIGTFFVIGDNSLLGRIKSLLGINSPSTVMREVGVNLIQGLMAGITGSLKALGVGARRIARTVITAVGSGATWLVTAGRNTVTGLANGLGQMLGGLRTRLGVLRTTVVNSAVRAGSWLYQSGRNVMVGLVNGMVSLFRTVGTYAGYARGYIQNALSRAGSYLYGAGRAVISGLINGISSRLAALGNFLNGIGSFIQANKGPIEKDRVLLVGAGEAIMGGLIAGIAEKKSALAAELANVSDLVGNTSMPALATDLGSVSADLSVSRQASLTASWAPGSTGDPLLDAIKQRVKFQFNGDPMAAFAS